MRLSFPYELPVEHDTTELHREASDDLQDRDGDIANHDRDDLEHDLLDETCHDFPFNRVHYMICNFCDFSY